MIWGFSHIIISQKMTIADSIKCIFALTRIKHIWFLCCSGGVVDEAEYRRWQKLFPSHQSFQHQWHIRPCYVHNVWYINQCRIYNVWYIIVTDGYPLPDPIILGYTRSVPDIFFRISKYIGYYRRFLPWGQYTPNMKALKEMPITNHRKVYWSTISA